MIKKPTLTLIVLLTLINLSCNTYLYPQYEKNPNKATDIIKFDLIMSHNTSKIWAPIKLFELSKQNMPLDNEGLKIKSCISKWAGTFLEETIENDLMNLESEYKNTYKTNPDLNEAILEYIQATIDFTTYAAKSFKNTEFTSENPTYSWENEILIVDKNDSIDSIPGKLHEAIDSYGYLRNYNIGPLGASLRNYSDDFTQPTLIHYMKKLATEISGQKSLKDSDNVDYFFYESNKEYLFNTKLCKKLK
mgnify:CR=1 FL=1